MQTIRPYLIGVAAAVLLGPVEPSFSQCPESEPEGEFKDIPVCITLDSGLGVGVGEYCSSKQNKIGARVGRNAMISLEFGEASVRTLFLDLSEALACACSTNVDIEGADWFDDTCDASTVCLDDVPSPTDELSDVRFAISGEDLDDLALNCSHEDNATLRFTFGEDTWFLRWGPYESAGGKGRCPGSGHITVRRTGDNDWSFETMGDQLACLYRQENPPHNAREYHGQFFVPFSGTAMAINNQTANLTECIAQDCRDRRDRLAVPTSCEVIGPCGTCGDGNCDPGEDECNCLADCIGVPPPPEGECEDEVDNDCDGLVDCDDGDCSADPACAFCGNGNCDPSEDQCNCDADCGAPPVTETACDDGIDNDCDEATDCTDADCDGDPACVGCDLGQGGDPCLSGVECCSGVCKRNGTCRR